MMTNEMPEEIKARMFFKILGGIITGIPAAQAGQRADYSIQDGTDRYVNEIPIAVKIP